MAGLGLSPASFLDIVKIERRDAQTAVRGGKFSAFGYGVSGWCYHKHSFNQQWLKNGFG
jgi:hypothetical protein